MENQDSNTHILINAGMAFVGFCVCLNIIPKFKEMFVRANLYGIDLSKKSKEKVPEATGVICGAVFLVIMFCFIPVAFYKHLAGPSNKSFPHHEYIEYIAALLSICCMIFLGFADDVLNLKWRHKLWLPTMASLPLLMVYFVNFNSTIIIVPKPLRPFLGFDVDLGFLYYVYMGMLAVFCTNAINILAGVNGLECGQSLVIAMSVLIYNFVEISGDCKTAHIFSIYFILPYIGVCMAMLYHNWYPSKAFVGDTFCYFSGMTFAVVAILGHFSKTMLLFFIPQVANFIYSVPQLFKLLPCPRHRLPQYDPNTDKVQMSMARVKKSEQKLLGKLCLNIFKLFGIVHLRNGVGDDNSFIEYNNLTLINFLLMVLGPLHERTLVIILLTIQVNCFDMAEEEEYEVLDLTAMRRNQSYLEQMLGDVTKQSAAKQVVIGGTAGCVSGYLSMKIGKAAAISVGVSLLLIRVAQHQGYIQINWSRVNREVNKAKRTVEREAARQYPHIVQNLRRFVQQNMFLAGSFAGGFLIGMTL